MPKITVSEHHADLLVDFFRAQEKELTEKLNGIRSVISELLGDAARAVAPKAKTVKGKRGRKPGSKNSAVAKAALDLLANATPKKTRKRGRPKGKPAANKATEKPASGTGKRGRPAKKAVEIPAAPVENASL